jgi:hypothetical protein
MSMTTASSYAIVTAAPNTAPAGFALDGALLPITYAVDQLSAALDALLAPALEDTVTGHDGMVLDHLDFLTDGWVYASGYTPSSESRDSYR